MKKLGLEVVERIEQEIARARRYISGETLVRNGSMEPPIRPDSVAYSLTNLISWAHSRVGEWGPIARDEINAARREAELWLELVEAAARLRNTPSDEHESA